MPGLLFHYRGHFFLLPLKLFSICLALTYPRLQRSCLVLDVIYLCLQSCNNAHAAAHRIFNNVAYVILQLCGGGTYFTFQCLLPGTKCTHVLQFCGGSTYFTLSAVVVLISLFSL